MLFWIFFSLSILFHLVLELPHSSKGTYDWLSHPSTRRSVNHNWSVQEKTPKKKTSSSDLRRQEDFVRRSDRTTNHLLSTKELLPDSILEQAAEEQSIQEWASANKSNVQGDDLDLFLLQRRYYLPSDPESRRWISSKNGGGGLSSGGGEQSNFFVTDDFSTSLTKEETGTQQAVFRERTRRFQIFLKKSMQLSRDRQEQFKAVRGRNVFLLAPFGGTGSIIQSLVKPLLVSVLEGKPFLIAYNQRPLHFAKEPVCARQLAGKFSCFFKNFEKMDRLFLILLRLQQQQQANNLGEYSVDTQPIRAFSIEHKPEFLRQRVALKFLASSSGEESPQFLKNNNGSFFVPEDEHKDVSITQQQEQDVSWFWIVSQVLWFLTRPTERLRMRYNEIVAEMGLQNLPLRTSLSSAADEQSAEDNNNPVEPSPKFVALHVRRGDACADGKVEQETGKFVREISKGRRCAGLEEYMPAVLLMLKKYNLTNVVLLTDDDKTVKQALSFYSNFSKNSINISQNLINDTLKQSMASSPMSQRKIVNINWFYQDIKRQQVFNYTEPGIRVEQKYDIVDPKMMDQFLIDLFLMSKATAMVGNFANSMDRMAYSLAHVERDGLLLPFVSLTGAWCADYGRRTGYSSLGEKFFC